MVQIIQKKEFIYRAGENLVSGESISKARTNNLVQVFLKSVFSLGKTLSKTQWTEKVSKETVLNLVSFVFEVIVKTLVELIIKHFIKL